MIIHNIEQRSREWFEIRTGLPTASRFDKILTPGGKISKQRESLLYELLSEFALGVPMDDPQTKWMVRGADTEAEAVRGYEFYTGNDTSVVGIVTNDAGTYGASPDRLVGDEGVLEIKCPAPHTHLGYLVSGKVQQEYKSQIQGELLVTERKWCDIVSYYPTLPIVVIRVERDEGYIAELRQQLDWFASDLNELKQRLIDKYGPQIIRRPPENVTELDRFGLTDEDVEAIIASHKES